MSYFLCKLLPPRPTFAQDMNDSERRLMAEHAAYWRKAMNEGKIIAFGPVAEPTGAYGVGIVEMKNASEVEAFGAGDPTIMAGVGFQFKFYPMPNAVYRGQGNEKG